MFLYKKQRKNSTYVNCLAWRFAYANFFNDVRKLIYLKSFQNPDNVTLT